MEWGGVGEGFQSTLCAHTTTRATCAPPTFLISEMARDCRSLSSSARWNEVSVLTGMTLISGSARARSGTASSAAAPASSTARRAGNAAAALRSAASPAAATSTLGLRRWLGRLVKGARVGRAAAREAIAGVGLRSLGVLHLKPSGEVAWGTSCERWGLRGARERGVGMSVGGLAAIAAPTLRLLRSQAPPQAPGGAGYGGHAPQRAHAVSHRSGTVPQQVRATASAMGTGMLVRCVSE